MANLTGGIYITFQKPYLNMVSEIIENNEQIKVGGRLQIIEQTDVVKSFLKSVKNKNERDIEKVLKVGSQYAGIFNTHKWTEIDMSQFTNLGGASDGKTTQQQELASLFAIQKSIENNGYTNQKKFYELYREDLIKIYPDMNEEWENTFFQQQLTTYREVGNTPYKHYSRDGGFMDYITGICKNKYGIAKKDTWNPADIWLVYDFPKVKRELEKYVMDDVTPIEEFNAILRDMFHARKIIGISLKKIEGSPKLKLLNDTSAAVRRQNEASYYAKYDLTFDNKQRSAKNEGYPMDCYFMYSSSGTKQNGSIQVRNFAGAFKGDWKLEVKGVAAAQGKIQGEVTRRLLSDAGYNIKGFTEPPFSSCKPLGEKGYNPSITTEIYNLLEKYKAKGFVAGQETMNIIATRSQPYRYSKLCLLYTSPSPRDRQKSRMPSSA